MNTSFDDVDHWYSHATIQLSIEKKDLNRIKLFYLHMDLLLKKKLQKKELVSCDLKNIVWHWPKFHFDKMRNRQ